MELITKAILVHSLTDIEVFSIRVNETNYKITRKRIEYELNKIFEMLKELKEQGKIKGIAKPRNKKIQKTLNKVEEARRIAKQSVNNISEMYYK